MTSDVLLDVRGLTVTYGGLRAVDDVEQIGRAHV